MLETKQDKKEITNDVYICNEYKCGYCSFTFQHWVRKVSLGTDPLGKPYRHNISTQVKCPKCSNILPTWDGAKEIKQAKHEGRFPNRIVK